MRTDRRKFIKNTLCAALGGASVYSALGQMQLLQAATRQPRYTFTDYKALVCVFMYGGNDSFNMIPPNTTAAFNAFYGANGVRPQLALTQSQLHVLNAPTSGIGSPGDGNQYALHPSMSALASLFNASISPVAIVPNLGTLVAPVTQTQYQAGAIALPPQLYSHADQQAYWQASPPTNQPVTGWGGRIADLVSSANPAGVPILTGLNGQDAFMRGQSVNGYIMNANSANTLNNPNDPTIYYNGGNPTNLQDGFNNLFAAGTQANALERTFAGTMNHSIATAGVINDALKAAPDFSSYFNDSTGQQSGYDIDTQLQSVAQLIWAANHNVAGYSGLKRQVFFVTTGGYDTHNGELATHGTLAAPGILELLSRSLAGFYNALNSVSLASNATAFTASDFGRTMTSNNGGTDHGWGSHHFVVGGAVKGKKFYGNGSGFTGQAADYGLVMPSLLNPTPAQNVYGSSPNLNDSGDGYGRMIPTTSVDQYAATLASWYGLDASDISLIFPNLSNFSNSSYYTTSGGAYLGFM
jgi:uncharacterized protein (DUF1501 family)